MFISETVTGRAQKTSLDRRAGQFNKQARTEVILTRLLFIDYLALKT